MKKPSKTFWIVTILAGAAASWGWLEFKKIQSRVEHSKHRSLVRYGMSDAQTIEAALATYTRLKEDCEDHYLLRNATMNMAGRYYQSGMYVEGSTLLEELMKEPFIAAEEALNNRTVSTTSANWMLAKFRLRAKDYNGALAAYNRAATTHAPSTGGCESEPPPSPVFYQGLCQEWLGNTSVAIPLYLAATEIRTSKQTQVSAARRLYQLYDAADRRNELGEYIRSQSPKTSTLLRDMQAVYDLAEIEDWNKLIGFLTAKPIYGRSPANEYTRLLNWKIALAGKLLAEHPTKTIPWIEKQLPTAEYATYTWLCWTLCQCDDPRARETLINLPKDLRTQLNWNDLYEVVAVSSGGLEIIKEWQKIEHRYQPEAESRLKAIEQRKESGHYNNQVWPPTPPTIQLPTLSRQPK